MCALTAPQRAIIDLYGGETVTAEVVLSLHFETGRVPLQNRPITAAGVCLLTGKDSLSKAFNLKRMIKTLFYLHI